MESKQYLEIGDTVYVLGEKGEVHDLVKSNTELIKVRMVGGPFDGQVFPVVLKQVERD